jgi:formylglycine-generating enzyme required for sulfatase activity
VTDRDPKPANTETGFRDVFVEVPQPWLAADRYGRWAAFEVAGVQQRMRWIPSGRFLMGSPETELGRYGDEGPQHEVILTRGYWLGETPVTQALWVAVMGKNPSRFGGRRPDDLARPVEQVS